jgi:hypothetical protein
MKLLTAFRSRSDDSGSSENNSEPLSLDSVLHPSGVVLIALCRDFKIRVYHLHQYVKTVSIPGLAENYASNLSFITSGVGSLAVSSASGLANGSANTRRSHNYLKVFRGRDLTEVESKEKAKFNFSVFIPARSTTTINERSIFAFFEGGVVGENQISVESIGLKNGPLLEAPSEQPLVEYQIMRNETLAESLTSIGPSKYIIWTLWDHSEYPNIRFAPLEIDPPSVGGKRIVGNTGDRWISVVSKQSVIDIPDFIYQLQTKSVGEILVDTLVRLDIYSGRTLLLALESYAMDADLQMQYQAKKESFEVTGTGFYEKDTLLQLARELVGLNHEKEADVALYNEKLMAEWQKFGALCANWNDSEHIPSGLSLHSSSGTVVVVRRGAVSTIRNCDYSEVVVDTYKKRFPSAALLMAPEDVIGTSYPKLKNRTFRSNISVFFELAEAVKKAVNADNQSALLTRLKSLLIFPTKTSLHAQLLELADTHFSALFEDGELAAYFVNLAKSVDDLEGLFRNLLNLLSVSPKQTSAMQQEGFFNSSCFTNCVVAAAFHQIMEARSALATDIVFVQIALTKFSFDASSLKLPVKTLAKSLAMLHSTFYTDCIAKIRVKYKPADPISDGYILPMTLDGSHKMETRLTEPIYQPLVRVIFEKFVASGDFGRPRYMDQLLEAVWNVFVWIGAAISSKSDSFSVSTEMINFIDVLMKNDYIQIASELLGLLPRSPAVEYLDGIVQLKLRNYEKSKLAFEKASGAVGECEHL